MGTVGFYYYAVYLKARCKKVFKGFKTPLVETVFAIWLEIVLTLRSLFENIIGDSDAAEQKRLYFHKTWTPHIIPHGDGVGTR